MNYLVKSKLVFLSISSSGVFARSEEPEKNGVWQHTCDKYLQSKIQKTVLATF